MAAARTIPAAALRGRHGAAQLAQLAGQQRSSGADAACAHAAAVAHTRQHAGPAFRNRPPGAHGAHQRGHADAAVRLPQGTQRGHCAPPLGWSMRVCARSNWACVCLGASLASWFRCSGRRSLSSAAPCTDTRPELLRRILAGKPAPSPPPDERQVGELVRRT